MKPTIYYGCSGCGIVSALASSFTPLPGGRYCVTCYEKKKQK